MDRPILQSYTFKAAKIYLVFMLTSVIGWIYEVFLEVVIYKWGFSNRGVLTGPYCPVYGFGAVILLACLSCLVKKKIKAGKILLTPIIVFAAVVLITTAVELFASYVMEWTTGGFMWDYSRFLWNFQGRIAPNPSVRFGVGGIVFLYGIYPCFEKLCAACSQRNVKIAALAVLGIFLADCIFTFATA